MFAANWVARKVLRCASAQRQRQQNRQCRPGPAAGWRARAGLLSSMAAGSRACPLPPLPPPHRMCVPRYIPDFRQAFDHFCLHAGGRAVVQGLSKQLGLSPTQMAPSANTLHWCASRRCAAEWQPSLLLLLLGCPLLVGSMPSRPAATRPCRRYGNTSSSTVWYSFGFVESVQGVRRGDVVWQVRCCRRRCSVSSACCRCRRQCRCWR